MDSEGPFTWSQALQGGVVASDLRGPSYVRLFRNAYVTRNTLITPEVIARAALLGFPTGARISHLTAGRLSGLTVPDTTQVDVVVPCAADRRRVQGVKVRVRTGRQIRWLGLVPVSPVPALLREIAEELDLVDLVVAYDQALSRVRDGRETEWAFEVPDLLDSATSPTLRRKMERAFKLCDSRTDSPMQTRTRLMLVLAGLPAPTMNFEVWSEVQLIRLDLAWPEAKVAVEYDARPQGKRQAQWRKDLLRREQLESRGWRLLVITADDYYKTPAQTVRRIWDALVQRRLLSGQVPPLSGEWRRVHGH